MLVFEKHKCLFQPVCKVATNSLISYWGNVMYGDEDWLIKEKAEEKKLNGRSPKYLGLVHDLRMRVRRDFHIDWQEHLRDHSLPKALPDKYKDYYKFAFVRNPWTRVVAGFKELIRRYPFGNAKANEKHGLKYDEVYDLMDGYISFDNFINFIVNIERNHTDNINAHWRPQVGYVFLNRGFEWNLVGKLENFDKDFGCVQEHLNFKKTKLEKEHVSQKYNHKLYYQNKKTIDMVGEYYKEDIETFGYEFETEPRPRPFV